MKTTRIFHLKVFLFLVVKFSIYLNRRVFVMWRLFAIICSSYLLLLVPPEGVGVSFLNVAFPGTFHIFL